MSAYRLIVTGKYCLKCKFYLELNKIFNLSFHAASFISQSQISVLVHSSLLHMRLFVCKQFNHFVYVCLLIALMH